MLIDVTTYRFAGINFARKEEYDCKVYFYIFNIPVFYKRKSNFVTYRRFLCFKYRRYNFEEHILNEVKCLKMDISSIKNGGLIRKNTSMQAEKKTMITTSKQYVPLITVVMPVYNVGRFLDEALVDVLNQDLTSIEVICVDDGSTDNSLDILKRYERKDLRVRVISQENSGAAVARNVGLSLARGKYVVFLDGDDRFAPDLLSNLYNKAERTGADVVVCQYRMLKDGVLKSNVLGYTRQLVPSKEVFTVEDFTEKFLQAFVGVPWNKLFKREFVEANRLQFQNLKNSNDTYFVYSALMLGKISVVDKVLVKYRIHENSAVRSKDDSPDCFLLALRQLYTKIVALDKWHVLERSYLNRMIENILWNYGKLSSESISKIEKDVYSILTEFNIFEKEKKYFYNETSFNFIQRIKEDRNV